MGHGASINDVELGLGGPKFFRNIRLAARVHLRASIRPVRRFRARHKRVEFDLAFFYIRRAYEQPNWQRD
jgi:hypothetical protein